MTDRLCHALLSGGARTIVFSADAALEPLYSRLRVNGKLDNVLRNIESFQKIRETQYSSAQIISRVSGVLVEEEQNMLEDKPKDEPKKDKSFKGFAERRAK